VEATKIDHGAGGKGTTEGGEGRRESIPKSCSGGGPEANGVEDEGGEMGTILGVRGCLNEN